MATSKDLFCRMSKVLSTTKTTTRTSIKAMLTHAPKAASERHPSTVLTAVAKDRLAMTRKFPAKFHISAALARFSGPLLASMYDWWILATPRSDRRRASMDACIGADMGAEDLDETWSSCETCAGDVSGMILSRLGGDGGDVDPGGEVGDVAAEDNIIGKWIDNIGLSEDGKAIVKRVDVRQ